MRALKKIEKLPFWAVPAGLFLLAFMVRLAYIWHAGFSSVLDVDSPDYLGYAYGLISGEGYTDGRLHAFRAPGYPFFAAAVFAVFGKSFAALKVAQAAVSSLAPVFIYYIAQRLYGRYVALASGLLACIYFGLVMEPAHLLSENVFTTLYVLAALLLFKLASGARWQLAAGAVLGVLVFTKPVSLLIAAAAVVWAFLRHPAAKAARYTAVGALGFLVVMGPWWIRNYNVFGAFVPVCLETGYVIMDTRVPPALKDFNNDLPELQRDRQNAKDAIAYIKTRPPAELLRDSLINLGRFFHPFMPEYDFTYAFIFPFWLYGIYIVIRKRDVDSMFFFTMAVYFPLAFLFCGTARHRHSIGPFFILLSAAGARALLEDVGKSPLRRGRAAAALLVWTVLNAAILLFPEPVRLTLKRLAGV